MLYHYYSRRFPFDWLNILGALSVIRMSFVNDRDLKDQTIQAKVPFLSVLVVFCCQSFPFLLFFCFGLRVSFSFPSIGFFRLVCCAFSASVTCSHSPMHFVAEGSASLFLTSLHLPPFGCCCCLFLGLFVCLFVWIYSRNRRKSGTVGSI